MSSPWQAGDLDLARVRKAARIIKDGQQRAAAQAPPAKVPVPRTAKALEALEKDVSRRCKAAGITKRHAYDAARPPLSAHDVVLADPAVAIPRLEEVGKIADEVAASTVEYAKRSGGAPKRARDRLKLLNDSGLAFDEWRDLARAYIFDA